MTTSLQVNWEKLQEAGRVSEVPFYNGGRGLCGEKDFAGKSATWEGSSRWAFCLVFQISKGLQGNVEVVPHTN